MVKKVVITVAAVMLLCMLAGITVAITMCSTGVKEAGQMSDRRASVTGQMAEQRPFNAQKRAYSYEEFQQKKEAFDQNVSLYESAKTQIASLRAEANFDVNDPLYKHAVTQMTDAAQTARNITNEYNAMSKIAYQQIWKDKGMPETLAVPAGMW